MHNTPFRFLDSPAAIQELRQSLEQIGLTQETTRDEAIEPNPYHSACLQFSCPWLSHPVEVHWHYAWWPDGTHSELERVLVVYDGAPRGEINVDELLRQKIAQPLVKVIVEAIVAAGAELTGKRK